MIPNSIVGDAPIPNGSMVEMHTQNGKKNKMPKIVVDFAGWIQADPLKTKFISSICDKVITGEEWLKLKPEERSDYRIECLIDAQTTALDGNYSDVSINAFR
tara:strand:+ start:543 stop:848 length:306 start_codon:yes stop_codon:yes gene_type:complete